MKLHPTRVVKDAYGNWSVEDSYVMPEGRTLRVLTMKRHSGNFVTTANVVVNDGKFQVHMPYSDYREVLGDVQLRGTSANVLKQHTEYAAYPDRVAAVMERAVAHYAPK